MKTVCVVGGGGYLGYHIGKFLKNEGVSVTLFDRSGPHESWIDEGMVDALKGFRFIQGDITDTHALQTAVSGAECVIHTASFGMSGKEQMPAAWAETETTNINGTVNVINACCSENVKALVYTSSYNVVFGGEVIKNGDETLPYFPLYKHPDHYSRTKSISEQLVLMANKKCTSNEAQLKTCALRLAGLVGPKEQRHIMRIVGYLKKGLVKIKYGDQDNLVDFVGLHNAVQAHVKAAYALLNSQKQKVVSGQAYFISDGVPVSNFEFFGEIIEGLGYKAPRISVPVWLVYVIAPCGCLLHVKAGCETHSSDCSVYCESDVSHAAPITRNPQSNQALNATTKANIHVWLGNKLSYAYCIEVIHNFVSTRWNFTPLITRAEVFKTGVTHHFSIDKARQHLEYEPTSPNNTSEIIKHLPHPDGSNQHPSLNQQPHTGTKVKSYLLDIAIGVLFAMLLMSYLPIIT